MLSRNQREGAYCGQTSVAERGARNHIRSRRCTGNGLSTASANLESLCRVIRRIVAGESGLDEGLLQAVGKRPLARLTTS